MHVYRKQFYQLCIKPFNFDNDGLQIVSKQLVHTTKTHAYITDILGKTSPITFLQLTAYTTDTQIFDNSHCMKESELAKGKEERERQHR